MEPIEDLLAEGELDIMDILEDGEWEDEQDQDDDEDDEDDEAFQQRSYLVTDF